MDPLILAHRGLRGRAPENSLAALEAARRTGCDGAEFDVRVLADRTLVLHHDATTRKGRRSARLRDLTWSEFQATTGGRHAALLGDVLAWAATDPNFWLDLELKDPDAAGELAAHLGAGPQPNVVVTTFDLGAAVQLQRRRAASRVGLLHRDGATALLRRVRDVGLDLLVVHAGRCPPRFVEAARSQGVDVWTWGVASLRAARRLAGHGVKAFIADEPVRLFPLRGRTGDPVEPG